MVILFWEKELSKRSLKTTHRNLMLWNDLSKWFKVTKKIIISVTKKQTDRGYQALQININFLIVIKQNNYLI